MTEEQPDIRDASEGSPRNINEEVFEWLKDPNLLENMVHHFGQSGVVGEPGSLTTVLLVYNSRLCSEPLNLSPTGHSGVGKSFLVCQPADIWKHDVVVLGYMSRTSLIHDSDWAKKRDKNNYVIDLTGKVLVILEAEKSRDFLDLMKPIRSHDKKEIKFAITEGKGEHRAKKVILRGWPVFITPSVDPSGRPEDSTRDLNITPAYSEAKGKAVNVNKGKRSETPWRFLTDNALAEVSDKWACAMTMLEPYKVVNPFATGLAQNFDARNPRSMRDFQKILSLFESSALLHQHQRMIVKAANGETYLIGTIDDLRVTLKLASILLEPTIMGVRADVLKAHEEFFTVVCPNGYPRTVKELMVEWSRRRGTQVKRSTLVESYLYPLRDAGLLNQDDSERTHKWEASSVGVSECVGARLDTRMQDPSLESGLRAEIEELIGTVGVSEVIRSGSPEEASDLSALTEEILSHVWASTIRQEFIDKLGNPLASCLRDERAITVNSPPTVADRPENPSIDQEQDFGTRVATARSLWAEGTSLSDIESKVGAGVVQHCLERGYFPPTRGGRA